MAITVLVVDDSGFFRRRVCEILSSVAAIKVVGTASNGREALDLIQKLKPDVVTMDYEMPVMDGVTAVRHIMATCPTPVLMFSSLTYEGARVTLDALEAGAVDYLPKNFEDISRDSSQMQEILKERILAIAGSRRKATTLNALERPVVAPETPPKPSAPLTARFNPPRATARTTATPLPDTRISRPGIRAPDVQAPVSDKPIESIKQAGVTGARTGALKNVELVAIGTSTGGPIALQKILTQLPANFSKPIVLIQHMPASFTPAFAERLNKLCQIAVKQAQDGDVLRPGLALLAPGGKQMLIERKGGAARIRILDGDERLHYKPCVDVTFGSAARSFPGGVLGIVLTGMGADGREGCKLLKKSGSTVWAQDEKTSVIYGMPMAVANAGLADEILPLQQFPERIIQGVM